MNIRVQIFVWTYTFISIGICPRVELLGHIITLCLTFEELPDCFSQVHSYHQCRRVNFPVSSPILIITCLAAYNHTVMSEAISHCGFDLHFSNGYWC